MGDKRHIISIDSDFLDAGYHAACTCGWGGPRRELLSVARSDGFEHEAQEHEALEQVSAPLPTEAQG